MNSNKKKTMIIVLAIVLALVILIAVSGIEFTINGVVSIVTKYYKTANDAYMADSDTVEEIEDIAVIDVDDYNAFYIVRNGENEIIVAEMKVSDSKYHYTGSNTKYDPVSYRVDGVVDGELHSTFTLKFDSKFTYGGKIEWALMKSSDSELVSEDFKRVEIDAKSDNETLVFVYRIIED